MNILEEIVEHKEKEIQRSKDFTTVKQLEQSIFFESTPVSLSSYLKREDKLGVIAEIKRKSPSTQALQEDIDVEKLSIAYMQSGASALSVLTDKKYFDGTQEDLKVARKFNFCPILRKDFIIDEYQIVESKSIGADCILLIAACLDPDTTLKLSAFAKSLKLEVLLEVNCKEEIETHANDHIDIIGINNRDLKTFKTNIQRSLELYEYLPKDLCKISESGISQGQDIMDLKACGFDGFLIGGHFMRSSYPAQACKQLIQDYKSLSK